MTDREIAAMEAVLKTLKALAPPERTLFDGRTVRVELMFFGKARLTVSEPGDTTGYRHGY